MDWNTDGLVVAMIEFSKQGKITVYNMYDFFLVEKENVMKSLSTCVILQFWREIVLLLGSAQERKHI